MVTKHAVSTDITTITETEDFISFFIVWLVKISVSCDISFLGHELYFLVSMQFTWRHPHTKRHRKWNVEITKILWGIVLYQLLSKLEKHASIKNVNINNYCVWNDEPKLMNTAVFVVLLAKMQSCKQLQRTASLKHWITNKIQYITTKMLRCL